MSGIVGMLRTDGAPVNRMLVRALTRFLAFRGPDAQDVWSGGPIGLGHAMLRTTEESDLERQPLELDGRLWITADARLDARAELLAQLKGSGRQPARNAADSELILHAYAAWGESCLDRLRGEFAFAIWDAQRRSLFCARDQLGIKLFYFTEHRNFFLFSNTLDCVRMHPDVPDELNEAAIADFLLFGLNCDPAGTTFRAIRRLPPAHFLRVSSEGLRIGRYWTMPVEGCIRHRRSDAYVENFQAHLRSAVADRLRGGRVGVLLSGGLDSSSLAATARALSPQRGEPGKLRAYTVAHDKSERDQDGAYAREVANFLGIPIRCFSGETVRPFERWDDPAFRWPEPVDAALMAGHLDQFSAIAAECRVVFNGEGPDNLMSFQMLPYVTSLLRDGELGRLCKDVPRFLRVRRFPWRGIQQRLKKSVGADSAAPRFPSWIAPDFAKRVNAQERWRSRGITQPSARHPVKPRAYASMFLPHWTMLFELHDAGVTCSPVEVRYPFLDLRIITYILAVPSFPWCFQKTLLREAMAGHLPENIRLRPKTPFSGDSVMGALRGETAARIDRASWGDEMERFVARSAYRAPQGDEPAAAVEMATRPLSLNFWLRHSRRIQYKLMAEASNG
jgi:asparagine synthase (glutamine-hydrolysing)